MRGIGRHGSGKQHVHGVVEPNDVEAIGRLKPGVSIGPGRVETLDFWKQLEPKDHGLPAFAAKDNTNPRAILWLKDHLNQHGIGAGHIKAVAERCKAVPAGAAEPVRAFK